MGHHCNSYGFTGGFAAVFTAIAAYLVHDRACKVNVANALSSNDFNADHLLLFHYVAIIVGSVLFVLSFFDFAGIIYEIAILFYLAVLAIFAVGSAMFYATWMAFNMSCKSAFGGALDTASLFGRKNVIQAEDEIGIAITVLDLIAACLLISAAISFGRRY